jgi:hypothetical protein
MKDVHGKKILTLAVMATLIGRWNSVGSHKR